MPVMYNTGDWFNLGPENTFRKIELYNIAYWPLDINPKTAYVCGAPYGGPIAIVRNFETIIEPKGNFNKTKIYIFTCSGILQEEITWKYGSLLAMGWTENEELLCVQSEGKVYIYDMYGEEKHSFSICKEANSTKIIGAKIFSARGQTGVAVMTTNFRIFFVENVKGAKECQMPEIPKSAIDPIWWELVATTEEHSAYCLVARGRELLKLIHGQTVCKIYSSLFQKSFKSIIMLSISLNHRYLAIYTNNGIVWLGTTDLKTKFCEFDSGCSERPKEIQWILDSETCRKSDAIIISYPSLILIADTNGNKTTFYYDPTTFLIPELDGVRILTFNTHELIQKVPRCVSNIFAINSQEPSSFLFEAHKKFLEKSHQSDEYLSLIRNEIPEAVDECIEAAGYEFDPNTQKMLIRAAYFGKGFIPSHNPDNYVTMCRTLRVLNNLRLPKIGLPFTFQQFNHLKADVVLDRLVFRKHYAIAVHVAKHLNLEDSKILEHWAFYKIEHDKDDEVANKIIQKFKNPTVQGVSFSNIAEKAFSKGRFKLALKLLDLEPKASKQVPLLLKLNEAEKALQCAAKSGDTDLVYTVLAKIRFNPQFRQVFLNIIKEQPLAAKLFIKYCKEYEKSTLEQVLDGLDYFRDEAEFTLKEGIESKTVESILPNVSAAYMKAHCTLEAELCSDMRKLLHIQTAYCQKQEIYGLTVQETLESFLNIGDLKSAEKLKNDYKIPDKRYWWARIQSLAKRSLWSELEKFSKSKKSPVGYEPFVEVCLLMNKTDEAEKYIVQCRDEKKVKWYIRAGKLEKAATLSLEQKDINSLYIIRVNAVRNNDKNLQEMVLNYIQQLKSGK